MTPGSRARITPARPAEDEDGGSIMDFLKEQEDSE